MIFDRSLRTTFGDVGQLYDSVRPSYPEPIIERILSYSQIERNGKIIEVGCGTGKSTIPFAVRGFDMTALDISEKLIAIARQNTSSFPNVKYVVTSFEEADLPISYFDLLISATAFHWTDPSVSYAKAYQLLKNNGTIALFWNYQDYDPTDFGSKVRELFRLHCPQFPSDFGSTAAFEGYLAAGGLFSSLQKVTHHWTINYRKQDYKMLLETFAWISSLAEKEQEKFFEELDALLASEDEPLAIPYKTELLLGRKAEK